MRPSRTVSEAGFDNVNLDLIYGLPRQSLDQWRDTLCRLAALGPAHISLYCLTVEEGTPLHRWVERGEVPLPDPDLAADMYQFAREHLREQGYHHYEISNWSRPGLASRHNLAYWRNAPYLGVGRARTPASADTASGTWTRPAHILRQPGGGPTECPSPSAA